MGFGSVSHSWEAMGSLTCSHLTRWRSHWLRRALLALSCAALEGCVKWVKSDCSSYPFQCILFHISFALVVGWNFSTGLLDFHRGSLISEWLSKLVFSRGSWTAAARTGAGSQVSAWLTPETDVCICITWLQVGKSPPVPLTSGAGVRTKANWGCSCGLWYRAGFKSSWDHGYKSVLKQLSLILYYTWALQFVLWIPQSLLSKDGCKIVEGRCDEGHHSQLVWHHLCIYTS